MGLWKGGDGCEDGVGLRVGKISAFFEGCKDLARGEGFRLQIVIVIRAGAFLMIILKPIIRKRFRKFFPPICIRVYGNMSQTFQTHYFWIGSHQVIPNKSRTYKSRFRFFQEILQLKHGNRHTGHRNFLEAFRELVAIAWHGSPLFKINTHPFMDTFLEY